MCTSGAGQAAGILGIAVFRLTSVRHSLGNKSCVTVSARVSAKCMGGSGKAVCTGLGGWVVLPTDPELVSSETESSDHTGVRQMGILST